MSTIYKRVSEQTSIGDELLQPEMLRLNNPDDEKRFGELIESGNVSFHDKIYDQLKELIKIRNPKKKLSNEEYEMLIKQHLGNTEMEKYGAWVFYPWSNRVVHILDEKEFVEVRTAANRNKITEKERDVLAQKKVGVIGLSVGQSVSLSLAMERDCTEVRLADFDTLELNNLNRIRSGVHNLGVKKIVVVAREIAEIDPFIKVVCFDKGITENNIDDFFLAGGKLDLVIDECDGIDIKILCRIKARQYNVPLLMEASDRGTLDVERYDLEPGRPIMHGWLEHLTIDFDVLKKLQTSEEKLPYMLPISGLDTLSPRMKASMIEIEETVTTWPQLASAVALGGALTADTCRRIFLNQFTASGRYHIDLERLIPDDRPRKEFTPEFADQPLTGKEMQTMADKALVALKTSSPPLEQATVTELIANASLAPSAGNNQPWKWYYHNNCMFLFHDRNRTASFGDFQDIASHVGLGAALENLELKACSLGIGTDITYFPLKENKKLVAVVAFSGNPSAKDLYQPEKLVQYITERETNRKIGQPAPINEKVYEALRRSVASIPGAELVIKNDRKDVEALAEIIGAAERLRLLHPTGHYEFYQKELRWTEEQSRNTGDGIDLSTVDLTSSEKVGLQLVKDPIVAELLADWRGGKSLERLARKSVHAASAIGLITMPEFSSLNYILGGRAVERMWLTATQHGISIQPMLAATLHFARLNHGNGIGMPAFMKEEFAELYRRFEKTFPGVNEKGEVFLFRICVAEKPKVKSYRLPVEKVLILD